MNLKTAEQWDALWVANRIDRLDCIRQIQADALKFAAHALRNNQNASIAMRIIEDKVYQLDPKPEGGV